MGNDELLIPIATLGWLIVWFGFHWITGRGAGLVIAIVFGMFAVDVAAVAPVFWTESYDEAIASSLTMGYAILPWIICAGWLVRRNRKLRVERIKNCRGGSFSSSTSRDL